MTAAETPVTDWDFGNRTPGSSTERLKSILRPYLSKWGDPPKCTVRSKSGPHSYTFGPKTSEECGYDFGAERLAFLAEYAADMDAVKAAQRAKFSFLPTPQTGYYVYLLIDPRGGVIFYVGKGQKKRKDSHARMAKKGQVDNAEKFQRISEILDFGLDVIVEVFSVHATEDEAYRCERGMILALAPWGITNIGGVVSKADTERAKAIVGARYMLKRLGTRDELVAWFAMALKGELPMPANLFDFIVNICDCCPWAYWDWMYDNISKLAFMDGADELLNRRIETTRNMLRRRGKRAG